MPEPMLNLRVSLPPNAVVERLMAAAASAPRVHDEAFKVAVRGEALTIMPPPSAYEGARAICRGSLVADGSGTRLHIEAAVLPMGLRILFGGMFGLCGVIAMRVGIDSRRSGNTDGVWAAIGFMAFLALWPAVVSFATTGRASEDVRAFVHAALAADRQAAG